MAAPIPEFTAGPENPITVDFKQEFNYWLRALLLTEVSIDIAPVANIQNQDNQFVILNTIDNPIVPDPDT